MIQQPGQQAGDVTPKFTELNDLSSEKVGGKIIFATDDWFAAAENLLKVEPAVFKDGVYTSTGKWMDGWETRRKRITGHDWCIIQLGSPGCIRGFDVNTAFFTGNYAPRISIQAATLNRDLPDRSGDRVGRAASKAEFDKMLELDSRAWEEIVVNSPLHPGHPGTCHNYFPVTSRKRWTHLRLNCYPDGGIARLCTYGKVVLDWTKIPQDKLVDLAAMFNGGICVGYSNVHFGHAKNLIGPGRAASMQDGWETARRLDRPAILEADQHGVLLVPGSEWAKFKLGHAGVIHKVEVDTNHYKGNYPDSCFIEGCMSEDLDSEEPVGGTWKMLLPVQKLEAHRQHFYEHDQLKPAGLVSHIRVTMAPDGGISRVRLWGYPRAPPRALAGAPKSKL